MKRFLAVMTAAVLISLALAALSGPTWEGFPLGQRTAMAGGMNSGLDRASFGLYTIGPLQTFGGFHILTPTPAPSFPDGGGEAPPHAEEFPTTPTPTAAIPDFSTWDTYERVTHPPVTEPPTEDDGGEPDGEDTDQTDDDTPPDTAGPDSGIGQYLTSEGPLFLSFRRDLTEEWYMFTPMDLDVDAVYHFPLIGNSLQVVGEARIQVAAGVATVNYYLSNGVRLDKTDEFFTFFPDIASVRTVDPMRLKDVKLEFGVPYHIANWLKSDVKVLLYINCPVSYDPDLPGLLSFSFEDLAYLERVYALLPLMD